MSTSWPDDFQCLPTEAALVAAGADGMQSTAQLAEFASPYPNQDKAELSSTVAPKVSDGVRTRRYGDEGMQTSLSIEV